ncbi:TetR/AcrR family transcriptional regulator [Pseudomaricurvus alkylphenolicus]|uniref:TetR/AcrR family transcriptional regulator n=1 Tax=Pseudomaricurvus alkylphenolicus TaxID=1306991 RepID=UPI001423C84E|nr:TetR/AcrR family transcriptional regulator [Pseudomaricurvus alkylphenolicus]NIB40968.1 TetR/AcrR family transcriptional regulator [Pseudomaricurvus alkylphenolicus]
MSSTTAPTANRQTRRKQKTRIKLLEAASEVFLDKGIENTTVTDITNAADVAYGTFYNYFDSVGDVVPVVAEALLKKNNEDIKELQQQYDDPVTRIAIGINLLFKKVMMDAAIQWLTQKPHIMADEIARLIAEDAMDDIRLGVESGAFKIPCELDALRDFLIWGFTGVLYEAVRKPDHLAQYTHDLTLIYLRVLGVTDKKAQKITQECSGLEN